MTVGRLVSACLAHAGLLTATAAFAAHPLQTEDTGTQGAGNIEIENAFSRSQSVAGSLTTFPVQVSYGLSTDLDLIVQPGWAVSSQVGGGTQRGFGATNADAKWRFYGEAPLSLAVRAGVALPTGRSDLGLPRDTVAPHATLVASVDDAPLTVHGNLGYVHLPLQVAGDRTSAMSRSPECGRPAKASL